MPFVPFALLCAALALSGLQACGRRGSLESPAVENAAQPRPGGPLVAAPVGRPARVPDKAVRPNEPFILDPLL